MLNTQVVQDRSVLGYQRHGYSLGFDLARLARRAHPDPHGQFPRRQQPPLFHAGAGAWVLPC
jgi:hypothetical protein